MGRRDDSAWSDRLLNTAIALVVLFALIIAAKGGVQIAYNALGEKEPEWLAAFSAEPVAKTFNILVTTTVIVAGAYVGYRKFFLFRENKPQLTVSLAVSSRPINDQCLHIGVVAEAKNTGKINVDVDVVEWELAVIAPYGIEALREIQKEYKDFLRARQKEDSQGTPLGEMEFPWHILDRYETNLWGLNVEPGETEEITFDFVAPLEVEAVVVSIFIENPETAQDDESSGWYRRTFHDISRSGE